MALRRALIAGLCVTTVAALAPAGAAAATSEVRTGNFFYKPGYLRIEPQDTVSWLILDGSPHTITTRRGAPESFDSGEVAVGARYERRFTAPGRYSYFCTIHPGLMDGVVQVGPDTVRPVVRRARARVGDRKVSLTLRLSEEARLAVQIRRAGRTVRTVRRRLTGEGPVKVAIARRGLAPGAYRARVVATDREDNASRAVAARFTIPG